MGSKVIFGRLDDMFCSCSDFIGYMVGRCWHFEEELACEDKYMLSYSVFLSNGWSTYEGPYCASSLVTLCPALESRVAQGVSWMCGK